MKRTLTLLAVATVLVGTVAAAAIADEPKLTGLDRAAQATLQGLEKSQGKAAEAPGQINRAKGLHGDADKLTGRERATAAIAAAAWERQRERPWAGECRICA